MAKPEWGSKRQCPSCAARFYDLGHSDPVVCVKCKHAFEPEVLLKPRRGRPDDKPVVVAAASADADEDEDIDAEGDLTIVSLEDLVDEEVDDDDDVAVIADIPDIDDEDADLLAVDGDEDDGLLETVDDDDDDLLPIPKLDD